MTIPGISINLKRFFFRGFVIIERRVPVCKKLKIKDFRVYWKPVQTISIFNWKLTGENEDNWCNRIVYFNYGYKPVLLLYVDNNTCFFFQKEVVLTEISLFFRSHLK